MERNPLFTSAKKHYFFSQLTAKKAEFLAENPEARLISLSVGDTTLPLSATITKELYKKAEAMGTREGYHGYGPEDGIFALKEKISEVLYMGEIDSSDIFISDGAASDIGRLQLLFGQNVHIGSQDPSYPAYVDTSLLFRNSLITPLPCTKENGFFFDIDMAKDCDILFLCSPNNPTGTAFKREELEIIVDFARKKKKLLIVDAAYAAYIQEDLPRSIYEIPGAKEVAIELGSFSKMAGFTGVRLSWSIVPSELRYSTGERAKEDWLRIITTFFNGPSILSQYAGLAALEKKGMEEIQEQIKFYLNNAAILRKSLQKRGLEIFGGKCAPYIWVYMNGKSSWQAFDELLERAHIIASPGVGFGPSGEGYLRLTSFGDRATIEEASRRLENVW
jgi:LL-diaminopimelate aminotransferase